MAREEVLQKKHLSGHPMFYNLLEKMAEIHDMKNRDYGNGNPLGNFEGSKAFGISPFKGTLVRMSDKWSRICSLASKPFMQGAVKDESIEDTLLDLANYSILAIVMLREQRAHENKQPNDKINDELVEISRKYAEAC